MENLNENNVSIIKIASTTLVKTSNSIAITNKILNEKNPNLKNSLLNTAIKLINQKKFKEAILLLDEIIIIDCLNSQAYFQRGISYYGIQKYNKAINDFNKVISIEPENVNGYTKLANTIQYATWAGKIKVAELNSPIGNSKTEYYQTAIQYCEKAIQLDSKHIDAYFIKGECLRYLNKYSDAVNYFSKVVDIDPLNKKGYIYRGFSKMALKDYIGVLQDEITLQKLDTKFSFEFYGYPNIKNIIASLEKYNQELAIDSSNSDALRNRGAIKFNAHDYHGAMDDISKAIFYNPIDSISYYFRAIILQNPNYNIDKTKAMEDLNTAIRIKPDNANFYLERAELRDRINDAQGVIDDCSIALSLNNTLARAYIFRGWAKENLYGLKYEENEDIHQYEKLTGEDMSGIFAGVNGNKKLYAI
jgi:tetratricopeptide (TPR) repeat protein